MSSLFNHLWQSTLFTSLAWVLTLALRKNHARARHWVWLAASCKFLIPLSMLMALGGQVRWKTVAEIPQSGPSFSYVVDEVSQPFTVREVSASPSAGSRLPALLTGIWICGFLGIACSWWIRWRRIRMAVRAGSPVYLDLPIQTRSSPTLLEPGVFGIFQPILLLPEGICDRLTPAQLKAVIAHELCHVRNRDNLIAAIHMFVETIFWFHPLVWWIGKRMVVERERACDEEVLRLGNEPRIYAEGILNICKLYVESPLACVSGVTGSDLKKRIQTILTGRIAGDLSFAKKATLIVGGIATLAGPIGVGMMNAPLIQAQSATAARPKFEVASIKPCKDEIGLRRGAGAPDPSPGNLSTGCLALSDENNLGLIQRAYVRFAGGHANPMGFLAIKGGPAWIHSEFYEINAKAEGNVTGEMAQGPMLQTLLEDRFKLKIHHQVTQGPVYALTLAKGGAKLKPFAEGSCIQMQYTASMPTLASGQKYCMARIMFLPPSVEAEGGTLVEFTRLLNLVLDRPVIDRTGIKGRFDLRVKFSPDQTTPGMHRPVPDAPAPAVDPNDPTIFTAMQEQLGLKLVPSKGPVEVLVIDHVERPSEN